MWARLSAMGSWAMRPSTIRAAWGLALPVLALSYTLHGGLFNTWTREFHVVATPHLMWLCGALWVGGIAGLLLGSRALDARPFVMRVTAVAAVGAAMVFSMWTWGHPVLPSSREFTAGLGNASALSSPPDAVTALPAPLGVDETFLVRRQVILRTYQVGSRELTIEPSPRERDEVRLRLEGELAPAYLQFDDAATFALHRIGPHWILVSGTSRLQRSVIGGPRAGLDLGVAHALPGRVGSGGAPGACIVIATCAALALAALAQHARRVAHRLSLSVQGAPILELGSPLSHSIRRSSGEVLNLATAVPRDTRTVFVDFVKTPATYRDEPRPIATVIHVSPFDRDETLARARTRIARLDALCVLIVLLLTAPALGAHLRGLTVSLPLAFGSMP